MMDGVQAAVWGTGPPVIGHCATTRAFKINHRNMAVTSNNISHSDVQFFS